MGDKDFRTIWGGVKPTASKRRRVDYGKIMALHNAGWSNAKIADEMGGMTSNSVAQAIYRKKHEMEVNVDETD